MSEERDGDRRRGGPHRGGPRGGSDGGHRGGSRSGGNYRGRGPRRDDDQRRGGAPRREGGSRFERDDRPRRDDGPRRDERPRYDRPRRDDDQRRGGAPRRDGGPRYERDDRPRRDSGPRGSFRDRSAQAPSQRARHSDPKRAIAFEVLSEVRESGAYANLVLPNLLREQRIMGRDAGFATELTYGTLRMQGRYDAIVGMAAARPLNEIDPPVLDVLRLGIHQLLGMRVAEHAAVAETVALAREMLGIGSSQFVNAILRTVSERTAEEWLEAIAPEDPDADAKKLREIFAIRHSHPVWMVRALREALIGHGRTADELPNLLAAHNEPPAVTLAARPGLSDRDALKADLAEHGVEAEFGTLAPTALISPRAVPNLIPEVRDATAGVQDEGSQVVALALTNAQPIAAGEQWLDLCSGPGGKAALLAAIANQKDAHLTAVELHEHRSELVRQATQPSRDAVTIRTQDGREVGQEEPGKYDRVLVDAPCTGMGALRRRPEARWRRTPDDLANLTPLQRELLESALEAVKPGGIVVYATCSPHLAETVVVVEDALRAHKDFEQLDAREIVAAAADDSPDVSEFGTGPGAQLWPHLHGTDAMFIAVLRRKALG